MTNSLLFLLIGAIALMLFAKRDNQKLREALRQKSSKFSLLPKAITLLAITSQTSELVKVLEHISPLQIGLALLMLTITIALKSGTESELY